MKFKIPIFIIVQFVLGFKTIGQTETKSPEDQKKILNEFIYCDRGNDKYARQPVEIGSTTMFSYYQSDSLRIYYIIDNIKNLNDSTSKSSPADQEDNFAGIFQNGLLTAKMFFDEIDFQYERANQSENRDYYYDHATFYKYDGPVIQVLDIIHLDWLEEKKVRRFEISIMISTIDRGIQDPIVFYLELTNKGAKEFTDMSNFIKEAETTCFKFGYFLE